MKRAYKQSLYDSWWLIVFAGITWTSGFIYGRYLLHPRFWRDAWEMFKQLTIGG